MSARPAPQTPSIHNNLPRNHVASNTIRNQTLQDLRLGRNQLAESGITALSAGLALSSNLLRLNLSGNLLNAAAARALGDALCGRPAPLQSPAVTADNAEAGANGAGASAGTGAGAAAGPPPLEFLDVSKNLLGDEGGTALLLALATSPTLTGLVLAETGLGAGAAAALAAALGPCPPPPAGLSVKLLRASGIEAGTAVAPASSGQENTLPPPPSPAASGRGLLLLKTLDVSKNDLGAVGAVKLAGALSVGGGPQLESLSIGYNDVGDEGAAALGRAAGPRLAVLDLNGNALSGAGLAVALSARGLREAKLFHNACGDEGNIIACCLPLGCSDGTHTVLLFGSRLKLLYFGGVRC